MDLEKFKKGYANVKHVVNNFVGKAKEKARESFAEGFYLARMQIIDRNPEADLSALDGCACPPRAPEWFSWSYMNVDEEASSSSGGSPPPAYFDSFI